MKIAMYLAKSILLLVGLTIADFSAGARTQKSIHDIWTKNVYNIKRRKRK